jgi:hypothetical protein
MMLLLDRHVWKILLNYITFVTQLLLNSSKIFPNSNNCGKKIDFLNEIEQSSAPDNHASP